MADSTTYTANRITYRGTTDHERTRARSGERVPLLDQAAAVKLVVADAAWAKAEAEATAAPNPTGSASLTRVGQGALPSLGGQYLEEIRECQGRGRAAPLSMKKAGHATQLTSPPGRASRLSTTRQRERSDR
jgi:hypothetical protein